MTDNNIELDTIIELNKNLLDLYDKTKTQQDNLSLESYVELQYNKKNIYQELIFNYIKDMDQENVNTMKKIIKEYVDKDDEYKKISQNFENIVNFVQKSNTDINSLK